MPTVAPYGSWTSPISAESLADSGHGVFGGVFVGDEQGLGVGDEQGLGVADEVWWLEARPGERGRYAVRRPGPSGEAEDVLPPPWNARSRVHEYGGGAWTVTADGVLIFANFDDQRLYRLDRPGGEPLPITPEPPEPAAWRYADLRVPRGADLRVPRGADLRVPRGADLRVPRGADLRVPRGAVQVLRAGEVWCVRERHEAGAVIRDIAAVPLDGSAAEDASKIRSVVGGSHFLAGARLSPSGRRLAWIAWEHPQMPWDGTELRVAELDADGTCGAITTLIGSPGESVLQPEWADEQTLFALSDRSGFWNLYRVGLDGSAAAVAPVDAEIGGPMWSLGSAWYRKLDDGRLLTVRTLGTQTVALLDPSSGQYADLDLGDHTSVELGAVSGRRAVVVTTGARTVWGVRVLDLATGGLTDVRLALDDVPDAAYLPAGEPRTFPGPDGRDVHAVVYRPHNADFVAPDGELPPFVAFVHGGPTSQVRPALSIMVGYYTSRGIGVLDVNYGGSTGYGRAYRERLRGQWGVVDVADTVAAVHGLAADGLADLSRLAIEGGSAGGWTVLAALTGSDAFACGVSRYGVAELVEFVKETHDFESRYVDGLVGPLPAARALYDERAPLSHVDRLSCPVLLLQGLDDPIVPPAQAERFRDALLAKGLPHAYRAYPGESHGFRRRETIIDAAEASLSFYGQILGFDPPGVPVLELWRPSSIG